MPVCNIFQSAAQAKTVFVKHELEKNYWTNYKLLLMYNGQLELSN